MRLQIIEKSPVSSTIVSVDQKEYSQLQPVILASQMNLIEKSTTDQLTAELAAILKQKFEFKSSLVLMNSKLFLTGSIQMLEWVLQTESVQ